MAWLDMKNVFNFDGSIDPSKLPHASSLINDLGTVVFNGIEVFHNLDNECMLGTTKFNWASTPSRNAVTFSFENMDDIDVGLVYYLSINFKYLNANDYYRLRKILMQRHFYVTFFSKDDMDFVTREMYLDDKDAKKLMMYNENWLGIMDYSINLIGTNRDLTSSNFDTGEWKYGDDLTVEYIIPSSVAGNIEPKTATWSQQIKLDDGAEIIAPDGYFVSGWCTINSNGEITGKYGLGQSITVWRNMQLHILLTERS